MLALLFYIYCKWYNYLNATTSPTTAATVGATAAAADATIIVVAALTVVAAVVKVVPIPVGVAQRNLEETRQ